MTKARPRLPGPADQPVRSVDVAVQGIPSPRWAGRLRRFCERVLLEAGAAGWELSLLLCDDERMRQLNGRYRGKDRPTDVLSFPRESSRRWRARPARGARITGDVAISMDTLKRNAREFEVTVDEELKRLVVHGILHCVGMDHGSGKGREMLVLQERLLRALKEERIIRR